MTKKKFYIINIFALIILLAILYIRIFTSNWGFFYFNQSDSLIQATFLKSIFIYKEPILSYIPGLNTFLFEFIISIILFFISFFKISIYMILQIGFNFFAIYFLTKALYSKVLDQEFCKVKILQSQNFANNNKSIKKNFFTIPTTKHKNIKGTNSKFISYIFATVSIYIIITFAIFDPPSVSISDTNFQKPIFFMPYFFSGWYYGTTLASILMFILMFRNIKILRKYKKHTQNNNIISVIKNIILGIRVPNISGLYITKIKLNEFMLLFILSSIFIISNSLYILVFSLPMCILLFIYGENKNKYLLILTQAAPSILYVISYLILKFAVNNARINNYITHYIKKETYHQFFNEFFQLHLQKGFITVFLCICVLITLTFFVNSILSKFAILSFFVSLIIMLIAKSYQDKYLLTPIFFLLFSAVYFLIQKYQLYKLENIKNKKFILIVVILILIPYIFTLNTILKNNIYKKPLNSNITKCKIHGNSIANYWTASSLDLNTKTKNRILSTRVNGAQITGSFEKRLLFQNIYAWHNKKINNVIISSFSGGPNISILPGANKVYKCSIGLNDYLTIYYYKTGSKGYKVLNSFYK